MGLAAERRCGPMKAHVCHGKAASTRSRTAPQTLLPHPGSERRARMKS